MEMEMEIKPQAAYTDEEMKPYQDIRIRHTFVRTSLLLFYSLWVCFPFQKDAVISWGLENLHCIAICNLVLPRNAPPFSPVPSYEYLPLRPLPSPIALPFFSSLIHTDSKITLLRAKTKSNGLALLQCVYICMYIYIYIYMHCGVQRCLRTHSLT